jgi:selenide,water dikinase
VKTLVLVGGGHAHIEVLRRFALVAEPELDLVLVNPGRWAAYSGMLPGLVAGFYAFEECHVDLAWLAARAGARLLAQRVVRLDAGARVLELDDGMRLSWDLLSLDIGSTPPTAGLAGAAGAIARGQLLAIKPVDAFLAEWNALAAGDPGALDIAVVGGGAGGVETVLAMRTRLGPRARLSLVYDSPLPLASHAPRAQRLAAAVLAQRGVVLHAATRAAAIEPGALLAADGRRIAAGHVVWATGAGAPAWPGEGGLAVDEAGFVKVVTALCSSSHSGVFAAGDCAAFLPRKLAKSGVYAVRQGPLLAENLRHALNGEPLAQWWPQSDFLALIGTGDGSALAARGRLVAHGRWAWRWKESIDRRFMRRYARGG